MQRYAAVIRLRPAAEEVFHLDQGPTLLPKGHLPCVSLRTTTTCGT
jgi:hypothetical protein